MKWSSCGMKKRSLFFVFWALMFAGAFLVVSQSGYSDGDDAFFYQYANSMGFFEYLGWRYETWVGRMAAEALVYITFHLGLAFWRPVNALMLTLLPLGVLCLAAKAARVPVFDFFAHKGEDPMANGEEARRAWYERVPACETQNYREMGFGAATAAVAGYFLMSAMTLGYAAIWVNGSIFYTWTFTCGIWALMPFADFVFSDEEPVKTKAGRFPVRAGGIDLKKFFYAIPCAVIASMSIEQMGAVLLVFEILGVLYGMLKWHRINPLLMLQTLVTFIAFAVLFAAPGNAIRVAAEVETWMPEYDTMSFGQHLFITVHWLLSSFANENKLFLCGIWIVGIMLIWQKKKRRLADWLYIGLAAVFTIAALLPYVGVTALADFGMQYLNLTGCIEQVPVAAKLTGMMWFAMFWWTAALIYTFVFLWKASGCQITLLLSYLAGIASEGIMFFSPTMYASGARVFYLTDILYLFVILSLSFGLSDKKQRNVVYGILVALGVINFAAQVPVFLGYMQENINF